MPQHILKSIHVSDVISDDSTPAPYRLYNIQLQVSMEQLQDFTKPSPTDKSWPSDQESALCEEIGCMINGALCQTFNPDLQLADCEKFAISITPHEILDAIVFGGSTDFGWYLVTPK